MWKDVMLVGAGGALGASLRFLAARAAIAYLPPTFPWGTFLINVTGCLAMGFVVGLTDAPSTRLFVATGILGGYTTFSAFGLEAQTLIADGRLTAAFVYVFGQMALGVAAVFAGLLLTRR